MPCSSASFGNIPETNGIPQIAKQCIKAEHERKQAHGMLVIPPKPTRDEITIAVKIESKREAIKTLLPMFI